MDVYLCSYPFLRSIYCCSTHALLLFPHVLQSVPYSHSHYRDNITSIGFFDISSFIHCTYNVYYENRFSLSVFNLKVYSELRVCVLVSLLIANLTFGMPYNIFYQYLNSPNSIGERHRKVQ